MATIHDLPTPCLIVEEPILERNLSEVADFAREWNRAVRPHGKTHKCTALARRQLARGAAGLTVATPWEAEVFSSVCQDLFVARSTMGDVALGRLTVLRASGVRLLVGVDTAEGIAALSKAATARGVDFEVRIEIDSGQSRCGVAPTDAPQLGRLIQEAPRLELEGVFTHEGHVYTMDGPDDLGAICARVAEAMDEAASLLRAQGHEVRSVSVGSTPARYETPKHQGITELRPGTYIYNDATSILLGSAREEDCAATVLTTVISCAEPGRVVVDAGSKAVAADGMPRQCLGRVLGHPRVNFVRASEEHGVLAWPAKDPPPRPGERLRIIPYHICPAVNLFQELALVRGEDVLEILPVDARGHGPLSPFVSG